MGMKLAVLGANEPLLYFYEQAKELGYEIFSFAWEKGAVCKKYADKFFPISFTEKEEILEICRDLKIDGITSFSLESALPTVIYVATELGLVSNNEKTLIYTGNKFQMRKICEENGIKLIDYWLLNNLTQVRDTNFKYPLVVKPNDGGGAKGITRVENSEQVKPAFLKAREFSRSKQVLVEEFVDGEEASAVFFSYNGKHHLITVTDKITSGFPNFIELEHSQPSLFSNNIIEKIRKLGDRVLNALGIDIGVTSIDLRVNPQGKPVIIEVNPRLGGNNINTHLVKLSTGFDIIKAHCEVTCGAPLQLPNKFEKKNAQVFYYTPYSLWVKEFVKNNENTIVEKNLKRLKKECHSNSERSGFVIYNGSKRINTNYNYKSLKNHE